MSDRRQNNAVHPGATLSINRARRFRRKLLRRIGRTAALPASPDRDAMLKRERERYARSGAVKAARLRGMKRMKRLPDHKICRLARTTDVLTQCLAPVRWHWREKRSGGYRAICDLPLKARLGQLIARDLIVAQIAPPPGLYDWPGRGIHRYVDAVREGFEVAGPFAVTLDIANCFPSIEISAIYALDLLPDELVRSIIDPRSLRFRYRGDRSCSYHTRTAADPGGLLQGGPASSALVVALLGDVFGDLTDFCPCGYADDFAVFGPDQQSAEFAGGELARRLAGSAMGPLQVRSSLSDVRDGCDHLGCYFVAAGDQIECWIPDQKLTSVIQRMKKRMCGASRTTLNRGADYFARVAVGPYRWAVDWQWAHILEEAEAALQELHVNGSNER